MNQKNYTLKNNRIILINKQYCCVINVINEKMFILDMIYEGDFCYSLTYYTSYKVYVSSLVQQGWEII